MLYHQSDCVFSAYVTSNNSCILSFLVLFELLLSTSAQLQVVKQLQDVNSAVKCKLLDNLSSQLPFVCSDTICQLNLSAQLQVVKQLQDVNSAVKCKLLDNLSSQLPFDCSDTICQLNLSAQSVCSAALRQLSCNTSVQLQYVNSAQLLSEGSVATCQISCQVSCNLSAQMNLPFQLQRVGSAVLCVLSCKRELKSTTENLKVVICP